MKTITILLCLSVIFVAYVSYDKIKISNQGVAEKRDATEQVINSIDGSATTNEQ